MAVLNIEQTFHCYVSCLIASDTIVLVMGLAIGVLVFLGFFLYLRKPMLLYSSQGLMAGYIISSIVLMRCPMFDALWWYLGIILAATVVILILDTLVKKRLQRKVLSVDYFRAFEQKHGVRVHVLDTQTLRAFVHHRNIYVSVGLIEQLEPSELDAVLAHELYHVKHGMRKWAVNLLRIISLIFVRAPEERNAHEFAAVHTGGEDYERVIKKLRALHT